MSVMSPDPHFLLCFPQAFVPHLKNRSDGSTLFSELLCLCMLSSFHPVRLFAAPGDYSPPGCPVHGVLQARILEWVAMPSPRVVVQTT